MELPQCDLLMLTFSFRGYCCSDSRMCPELPQGSWAAGHGIGNCVFSCLGSADRTLWQPNVGFNLSNQRPSQKKLGLDKMVRNVTPLKSCFSFPILMTH